MIQKSWIAKITVLECGGYASLVELSADWRTYRLPAGRASVYLLTFIN